MRIVRRKPLSLLDPPRRFSVIAKITVRQTGKTPGESQIRIKRDGAIMERPCLFGTLAEKSTDVPREGHRPGVADI